MQARVSLRVRRMFDNPKSWWGKLDLHQCDFVITSSIFFCIGIIIGSIISGVFKLSVLQTLGISFASLMGLTAWGRKQALLDKIDEEFRGRIKLDKEDYIWLQSKIKK